MAIKHEAAKASGERGYASEWNADHVVDGDVSLNKFELQNAALENRTSWPADPVTGQIIFRTDLKEFFIFDGTDWKPCITPIPHGTYYWSAPGNAFLPEKNTKNYTRTTAGIESDGEEFKYFCPVNLPHGAVVTGVIVWGIDDADTWQMRRLEGATIDEDQMATANFNTEDTSISFPVIDNRNWSYFIVTGPVLDGITMVRITYTLV